MGMGKRFDHLSAPVFPGEGHMDLTPHLLFATERFEEPHYLLEYNGTPFSPLGGIQALSGHKKNGKSFVVAQLMAAILNPEGERMRAKLPGLRIPAATREYLGDEETTVLYVDTEMERLNTGKVLRRVHWLCGWPLDEVNDRFKVLWLRDVDSNVEKQAIVMDAIAQLHPTAVFIDGIRDIVRDFNDNEESAAVIATLMKVATEENCCIWNVLHFNPKLGGDTEGKMRGHLGTELGNKVTDTFSSLKRKTANGVFFTVSQVDARGKDVDDWSFEVTDDAGELGIPRMCDAPDEQPEKVKADSPDAIKSWLTAGQNDIEWPATVNEIKTVLKNRGGIGHNARIQADIEIAKNRRFIIAQTKDSYAPGQKHPKYEINREEIPF